MENMRTQKQNPKQGFSLMELMVAMSLGLLVMTAMASLFKSGMNSVMLVTQRAENQQNMRAAVDLMTKDLSMAGAGMPSGGIQLPSGAGSSLSKFGCDQGGTCHITSFDYPGNYMYGILPGYLDGVEAGASIPAAPAPAVNDAVTVAYCDYNFQLFEYTVTPNAAGTSVVFTPSVAYPTPPLITAAGGIQKGDLIMLSNNLGTAVGEATTVSNAGTTGTIAFADLDPLNINQSGAAANNIKAIAGGANTVAYRLFVVTYYLTVPAAGQTPRLMRQVNGLTPVPVADDIINLQFAYDTYNQITGTLDANQANPIGVGESPNNIQKINLVVMGQSILNNGNKSQNMYLATDISARNMAFRNSYQ
jgi:prepilin-type N-terminal cleavage/methylation domain-containing protein